MDFSTRSLIAFISILVSSIPSGISAPSPVVTDESAPVAAPAGEAPAAAAPAVEVPVEAARVAALVGPVDYS